jgi:hypothetical protein
VQPNNRPERNRPETTPQLQVPPPAKTELALQKQQRKQLTPEEKKRQDEKQKRDEKSQHPQ